MPRRSKRAKYPRSNRAVMSMILLIVGLIAALVLTKFPFDIRKQAASLDAGASTSQLLSLLKKYNSSQSSSVLNSMVTVAASRQQVLLAELKTDVTLFNSHAVLAAQRQSFPSEVQQYLEETVTVDGELVTVRSEDIQNKKSENSYLLTTKDKKYFAVYVSSLPNGIKSGSTVSISGIRLKKAIAVASAPNQYVKLVAAAPKYEPSYTQDVIIALMNFEDEPPGAIQPQQIEDTFFGENGQLTAFFEQASYGGLTIVGDAVGWYTIPFPAPGFLTECEVTDIVEWIDAANEAMFEDGINPFTYMHKVYASNRCNRSYSIGYPGSLSFIGSGRYNHLGVVAHELGHNMTYPDIGHANLYDCGDVSIDVPANCTSIEYGDPYDVMGYNIYAIPYPHMFSGGVRNMKIWWDTDPLVVDANGEYTLKGLESNSGTRTIHIKRPVSGDWYVLSYRQAVGFDDTLPANIVNGVSVQLSSPDIDDNQPTNLLDMTPLTDGQPDEALTDGQIFTDLVNHLQITQLSHSATEATVKIQYLSCPPALIEPADDVSIQSTEYVTYTWNPCPAAVRSQLRITGPNLNWTSEPLVDSTFTPPIEYQSDSYYVWKVRGCSNVNCTSFTEWSPARQYHMLTSKCGTPQLTSIRSCNGTTVNTTWSWASIPHADDYLLQVDDQSNFSSPLWNGLAVSPHNLNNLISRQYYGRIRVEEGDGTCLDPGNWSAPTLTAACVNASPPPPNSCHCDAGVVTLNNCGSNVPICSGMSRCSCVATN